MWQLRAVQPSVSCKVILFKNATALMLLKIQAFWDEMCQWASGSLQFRDSVCPPLQTKRIK
jgi:hypothetical protein